MKRILGPVKKVIVFSCLLALLAACSNKVEEKFVQRGSNVWYRLISFSESGKMAKKGEFLHVRASFVTLEDSLFWDSYNNLRDLFFLEADSTSKGAMIANISKQEAGDSICLVLPVQSFMREVYQTDSIPFFLKKDSAVKVFLKLEEILSDVSALPSIKALETTEFEQIERFLGGPEAFEKQRDPLGFFWLEKPETAEHPIDLGAHIKVRLEGSFLSGRKFDQSAIEQEFYYGSPDQVLQGINYVIGRMEQGQTAKIILPSRLAFGEFGSSNGAVPPYTPLIFNISIEEE